MSDNTNQNLSKDTSENQEPTPDEKNVELATAAYTTIDGLPDHCPPPTADDEQLA
jgi:hypothetical protein